MLQQTGKETDILRKALMMILAFCLLFCLSACDKSLDTAEEFTEAKLEETDTGQSAETVESIDEAVDENQNVEGGESDGETDDTAEIAEESVVMTESYEQGRQNYYDATGIMLPEIADVTMADSSCFEAEYACFDITGTYDLYTEIVAFFTGNFGSAPETGMNGTLEKSFWEFENTDGGTDSYEVYWNPEGLIYINYWTE